MHGEVRDEHGHGTTILLMDEPVDATPQVDPDTSGADDLAHGPAAEPAATSDPALDSDAPAATVLGDPLLGGGRDHRRRAVEVIVTVIMVALGAFVLWVMDGTDRGDVPHQRTTTTTVLTTPAGCAQTAALVAAHGLPAEFVAIAWRESRCQHWQVNHDGEASYGLFQINTRGRLIQESRRRCGIVDAAELLDPVVNVRCAAALYAAYGDRPWRAGQYFR